jgi:phosphoglycolate phosphatase-like HAD superfamily hydrolase
MNSKETLSNVSFLISDFDGTLVDSAGHVVDSFVKTMDGIVDDEAQLREYFSHVHGRPLSGQIKEAALKYAGREIEDTKELEAKFFDYFGETGVNVIPGALDTLREVNKMGIRTAVWSGTRTDVLGKKLAQASLAPYVDFHIGNVPGSDTRVKGPVLFLEIAGYFNIPPQILKNKAVVIGDGNGDIEAGLAVGARTIGLGPDRENLLKAGANIIIPTIADLPQLLRLK